LIINNLSSALQTIELPAKYQGIYNDLLASDTLTLRGNISLQPYTYLWLEMQK
jgi:hypothetical protein